jgi:hypothetical protein
MKVELPKFSSQQFPILNVYGLEKREKEEKKTLPSFFFFSFLIIIFLIYLLNKWKQRYNAYECDLNYEKKGNNLEFLRVDARAWYLMK